MVQEVNNAAYFKQETITSMISPLESNFRRSRSPEIEEFVKSASQVRDVTLYISYKGSGGL